MITSHIETAAPRRMSLPSTDDLFQQLAVRDAAIAQLEQRCAELIVANNRAEAEAVSMAAIVELATQYITATDAATSGAAYLELRRAVAERRS